jgi:hypothetical protein
MTEITVGIYQKYSYPDLFRQTRGVSGIWGNTRFLINKPFEPCDVLVVLNTVYEEMEVQCRELWLIIQEPPIDIFSSLYKGPKRNTYTNIYAPVCSRNSNMNCYESHGALPWHVDMTYDQLKKMGPPDKKRPLSCITTNKALFPGHKERMQFLDNLKSASVEFDLFGRGFNPLDNKYDGLAPYRYSLAVENCSAPHYWTEKLADCFLTWTMPVYYGCNNLEDYFPKESFVQININDPNVCEHINDIARSDLYLKHRDAITEARNMVLDKYQLFPFITDKINKSPTLDSPLTKKRLYPIKEGLRTRFKRTLEGLLGA